jgi:hypothetical protein
MERVRVITGDGSVLVSSEFIKGGEFLYALNYNQFCDRYSSTELGTIS